MAAVYIHNYTKDLQNNNNWAVAANLEDAADASPSRVSSCIYDRSIKRNQMLIWTLAA